MTRRQKKSLWQIIISSAVLICAFFMPYRKYITEAMFFIAYIVVSLDVIYKAIRNIAHGQVFDENFLMSIASVGALTIGEYSEGVAVILFYQIGELFNSVAVGKSRKSIAALMDIILQGSRSTNSARVIGSLGL